MIYLLFGAACVVAYLLGMWVGINLAVRQANAELEKIVKLYEAKRKVDELYGRR
jgi:hypothetical protein